jgi:hypothetical protein
MEGELKARATRGQVLVLGCVALIAAFVITAPAEAKPPKLDSIVALAQALAPRIRQKPGAIVYVAFPGWKGHKFHYLLRKEICNELAGALSAALPADKIYTPAEAAGILRKAGFGPLDVYFFRLDGPTVRTALASLVGYQRLPLVPTADSYIGGLIGASVAVTSTARAHAGEIILQAEAEDISQGKRLARLRATLADAPALRALLDLPDTPIEGPDGAYAPGIGGVGQPRCIHCPKPRFTKQAVKDKATGAVLLYLTVGAHGRVSDPVVVANFTRPLEPSLALASLEEVRKWQLRGAVGPSQKPVPVRVQVEFSFSLLNP